MPLNNLKSCLQAIRFSDESALTAVNARRNNKKLSNVVYTKEQYRELAVEALKKFKGDTRQLNIVKKNIDVDYLPKGANLESLLILAGVKMLAQVSRLTNLAEDLQAKTFEFLPDTDFPSLFKTSPETSKIANELYWRQKFYRVFHDEAQ